MFRTEQRKPLATDKGATNIPQYSAQNKVQGTRHTAMSIQLPRPTMLPSITGVAAQEQGHERSDEEGEVDHKHAHALDGDIPHTTDGADQQHKDQDQEQDQHYHQHHQHHQHHHHLEHFTDTTPHKHNHGAITANEKENDDPNEDIKLTAELLDEAKIEEASDDVDTTIDHILNDEERTLPKDVGEINVQGHLRFDEEMPPDMETQKNTIHNALMYQITDDDDSEGAGAGAGSSAKDHLHHLKGDKGHKTITFDTYNPNIDVTHYQTTIIFQHKHFQLHNTSRTFMIPFDEEKPSIDAITWALQEMVNDNDIVVVVKVVSLPFIMKNGVQAHRKNCKNLFKRVCDYNVNDVKLKIIVEIRIGAAEFALARAIKDFDPTFLVMGTKGLKKTKLTSFLTEDPSLTKHYLDNGRVPVIVVNPYYDPAQYGAIRDKQSTEEEIKGEHTFSKKLATYPSVYDPHNALHTMEMERAANGVAPNTSAGRTSRFLRISRTVSRGSSTSSQSGLLSPTTSNDLSPVRSGSRGLSPIRAMSPFRLFHRH